MMRYEILLCLAIVKNGRINTKHLPYFEPYAKRLSRQIIFEKPYLGYNVKQFALPDPAGSLDKFGLLPFVNVH